jgi:hypothetical protein
MKRTIPLRIRSGRTLVAGLKTQKGGISAAISTADGVFSTANAIGGAAIKEADRILAEANASLTKARIEADTVLKAAQDAVDQSKSVLDAALAAEQGTLSLITAASNTVAVANGAVTQAQAALDLAIKTVKSGAEAAAFQIAQQSLATAQAALQEAIDKAESVLRSLTIISISGSSRYSDSNTDLELTVSGSLVVLSVSAALPLRRCRS